MRTALLFLGVAFVVYAFANRKNAASSLSGAPSADTNPASSSFYSPSDTKDLQL